MGPKTGQILRSVLEIGGLKDIFLTADQAAAFSVMAERSVDIVIIEDAAPQLDGVELTREIRTSGKSTNIKVPVLLTLEKVSQQRMLDASNAGVNEILMRPFTPKKFYERIDRAINDTRRFVISDAYVGPDRRIVKGALFKGHDRRAAQANTTVIDMTGSQDAAGR
jgi:PleD family two-component response regulator